MGRKEELLEERKRIDRELAALAISDPQQWQVELIEKFDGGLDSEYPQSVRLFGHAQWCRPRSLVMLTFYQNEEGLAFLDAIRDIITRRMEGEDI